MPPTERRYDISKPKYKEVYVKMKLVVDTEILYHITKISQNNSINDINLKKVMRENKCYLGEFSH